MKANYFKTRDGMYINLDNVNYFMVDQSWANTEKYRVCALFGPKPGYTNEGTIVKDLFDTFKDADNWIEETLLEK